MRGLLITTALLLLAACSREGVGRTDLRIVPNENLPLNLVEVPVEEAASTAELLELEGLSRPKRDGAPSAQIKPKAAEPKPSPATPRDFRTLSPDEQMETAQAFRRKVLGEDPLKPLPAPRKLKQRDSDEALSIGKQKPSKTPAKAKKEPPRTAGQQLFAVEPANPAISTTLPPGQFFKARLIGNVTVTAFQTPVFAEIYAPDGRSIGIAVGKGALHPRLKDRALLTFNELHLKDGTVTGALEAFEADLSVGLRGEARRKTLKRVLQSVVETALAALSLEVDAGDDFGGVFKVQLADRLMEQANDRLEELDLERIVALERDTWFWVASTDSVKLQTEAATKPFEHLTQSAMAASVATTPDRKAALNSAYDQLRERLKHFNR